MQEASYNIDQFKQNQMGESDMAKLNRGINKVVDGSFKTLEDQAEELSPVSVVSRLADTVGHRASNLRVIVWQNLKLE